MCSAEAKLKSCSLAFQANATPCLNLIVYLCPLKMCPMGIQYNAQAQMFASRSQYEGSCLIANTNRFGIFFVASGQLSPAAFCCLIQQTVCQSKLGKQVEKRITLARSNEMDALIRQQVELLTDESGINQHIYDGLIYMMLQVDEGLVSPLSIGKAETIGKGDMNLSANLKNIGGDTSKRIL